MLDAGPTRNLGFRGPFIDPKYGSGLKGWNSPKAGALRDNEEESHCAKCFSLGGPAQCWSHEVWRTLHLQPWEAPPGCIFVQSEDPNPVSFICICETCVPIYGSTHYRMKHVAVTCRSFKPSYSSCTRNRHVLGLECRSRICFRSRLLKAARR